MFSLSLRRTVKQQAKLVLSGYRPTAVGMLLLTLLVIACIQLLDAAALNLLGYRFEYVWLDAFIYSDNFFYALPAMGVSLITTVLWLVLVAPMSYGMVNWYLELTDRRHQGVSYLFWHYECRLGFRAVCLYLNVALRVMVLGGLLLLPALGLLWGSDYLPEPFYDVAWYAGELLLLPAGLFTLAFAKRYALASTLVGEKYGMTAGEARRASVRCTKGHRWALVWLDASFLPWLLPTVLLASLWQYAGIYSSYYNDWMLFGWLTLLVGLVTLLVIQPYLSMSRVVYARYLYEAYSREEAPAPPTPPTDDADYDRPASVPPPAPAPEPNTVQWRDIPD